jgi:hypothetical protein
VVADVVVIVLGIAALFRLAYLWALHWKPPERFDDHE